MNLVAKLGQKNRSYTTNQAITVRPTLFAEIVNANPYSRAALLERRAFKPPGDLSMESFFQDESTYNQETKDLIIGFRDVLFLKEFTEKNGYSKRLIVGVWDHSRRSVHCYKFDLDNQKTKIDFTNAVLMSWEEGFPFEERFLKFIAKVGTVVSIDQVDGHLNNGGQFSYYALSKKGFLTRFKDNSSLRSDHILIFKVSAPIPPGILSKSIFEKKKTIQIKSNAT